MEQTISLHCSTPPPLFSKTEQRSRRAAIDVSTTGSTSVTTSTANASIILSMTNFKSLSSVRQLHAHVLRTSGDHFSAQFFDILIRAYSNYGDFNSAAMVFFMGFNYGVFSWNYLVDEFGRQRANHESLEIFQVLHRSKMNFSVRILTAVLRTCAEFLELLLGEQVHALALKLGWVADSFFKCSMMDFYAASSSFESLEKLFASEIPLKDSILWNKAVTLYVENGLWIEGLELFEKLQLYGIRPDEVTVAKVMHACGKLETLRIGMQVHAYVIRFGLSSSLLVSNSLIAMYSKISSVDLAFKVFKSMEYRNLVSWNSMISCYSRNGLLDDAMDLLSQMISSNIRPDLVTWNCLLSGYSINGFGDNVFDIFRRMQADGETLNSSSITSVLRPITDKGVLKLGKEVHCYILRHGLERNVFVGTSLVDMYVKCSKLADAEKMFRSMSYRNVCAWNSLISGYAHDGLLDEALDLLKGMEREGVEPDLTTWNSLICGFSSNGHGMKALMLLRKMKFLSVNPNVISWTALISGCCQNGNYEDCLRFFAEMINERIEPNEATIASLLRACSALAFLKKGKELHCFAIRNGFAEDVFVATALVDMYCKSGSLQTAYRVFENIANRNLVSWNAIIMGFASHGEGKEAISLFNKLCKSGLEPDSITFTALLSACRHSGLITEGLRYFDDMQNYYHITPRIEHYASMVDLLARGGHLDEALDFIENMPLHPDARVWGALLAACRTHRNLELAEVAAKHLFKLEPYNPANYILMTNLYAHENRWEDVENMRCAMNAAGVTSRAGWSWIQIQKNVHVFDAEGEPHPEIGDIYFELYRLISRIKTLGYVPDTSCIVYNVRDEEKEKLLLCHTEKLAITYGLINRRKSSPIRVITNTRVCNDCHTVAKYMSKVSGYRIILRDGTRFHHFMDGECSCNGYW